jgi:hypothetical protein
VSDEQITAVDRPTIDGRYSAHEEQLVLAFVDEVIETPWISGSVFGRIRSVLSPRQIVELLLVGWYWTACRLTTALDIEPERALGVKVDEMLQDGG